MTEKAALLIRRRRLLGESGDLAPGSIPGVGSLRGTAGAGRVLQALRDLDLRFRSVIQAVVAPDLNAADIDHLDCDVLIEHHPIDWAETAAPTPATPGAEVGMTRVQRDPPFVSAVSVYDVGGEVVRQPFTARVLSEAELGAELQSAGLFVRRRLSPTWLQVGPIEPRQWSVPQPSRDDIGDLA